MQRSVLGFGVGIMAIQLIYLIICFSSGNMNIKHWAALPDDGTGHVYSLGFYGLLLSFPHGVK
jgi:hypothetical protein